MVDIVDIYWGLYLPTNTLAVPTLPLFQVLIVCPRITDIAAVLPMNQLTLQVAAQKSLLENLHWPTALLHVRAPPPAAAVCFKQLI